MARGTVDRSADGSACDSRSGHPLGHTGSPGCRAHRGHDELHEFYVKVARKIRALLSKVKARNVVGTYLVWCLEPETGDIHEAFRIEDEASIKLLGCLIVAAAARSGARRVLSEDLNPGQIIAGVTVANPSTEAEPPPTYAGHRRRLHYESLRGGDFLSCSRTRVSHSS